ncbi:hypothetical protein ACH4UV_35810 [Streptomyces sp. NPDC020802]|uniref:hypothetical protein n=1 Tax=Streptomyces sp. NPDC020802 TaxID=3365094 RepID=UPI00378CC870
MTVSGDEAAIVSSDDAELDGYGPLSRTVLDFERTVKRLVRTAKESGITAAGWAPLARFVDVDEFERVGTWMEVMNWREYTEFMTKWATSSLGFETTVRRVSELPGLVYFEIEERHTRPDAVAVVNSLSVYGFDADGRIRRLEVYLQQPR